MRTTFIGIPFIFSVLALFQGQGQAQQPQAAQPQAAPFGRPNIQSKEPRKIQRRPGKPVDAELKPTDQEIELLDLGQDPGLAVLDESGKLLETMARSNDLVAVVRVLTVASELTPDRTWVKSVVTAEIIELWKSSPAAASLYAKGSQLLFPLEGGTVTIGNKVVRARVSWSRALKEGNTYLVFGWFPEGELRIPLENIYQVVGPRLRSLSSESRSRDDIERDTLNNLKSRAEHAIQRVK